MTGAEVCIGGNQDEQGGYVGFKKTEDAEFASHAREDVPWLLDALAQAERERDAAREQAAWMKGSLDDALDQVMRLSDERDRLKEALQDLVDEAGECDLTYPRSKHSHTIIDRAPCCVEAGRAALRADGA